MSVKSVVARVVELLKSKSGTVWRRLKQGTDLAETEIVCIMIQDPV